MKRFPLREFLFLCAPVAVIGAGFTGVQLLHPPRDPDAVIALELTSPPNPRSVYTCSQPTFDFEWEASARGGPQDNIQLLYTQKLVALGNGDGRSQIIFQEPASPTAPNLNDLSFSGGVGSGPAQCDQSQGINIPYQALPIWTKRVEWRGDFVAVPMKPGAKNVSGIGIPSTFPTLARVKGSKCVAKIFPVRFDIEKLNPFQELELEDVSPTNASKGADTCVTTQFRDNQRRIYARLVAMDNGKVRQLWGNDNPVDALYWVVGQGSGGGDTWRGSQRFKLRDVPAQWGELVYIVDAAINPNSGNSIGDNQSVDATEIERLKKAGWLIYSKHLTVRRAGATIAAPNYSVTPNTRYLGTQATNYKTGWSITARLRYDGPKLKPGEELNSPFGPEFSDAKGHVAFAGISYRIKSGTKPNEYLVEINIPAKSLGQPRPVTMKMEIADKYAMPLHFQAKLQVPKAPA